MRVPSLPLRATTAFVLAAFAANGSAQAESCTNPHELKERVRADFVFRHNTGEIIYAQNINESLHPASLTKMMAGVIMAKDLVETHRLNPEARITFEVPAYKSFVRVTLPSGRTRLDKPDAISPRGVTAPAETILSLGITRSVNDAMYTVAASLDGSEHAFVTRMNNVASSIGMLSTHYTTSSGWPTPEALRTQRTTAFDQAILLRYVHGQADEVQDFFRQPSVTFRGVTYPNTNKLFRDSYYRAVITGSKTGFTCSAGRNVIMNVKLPNGDFGVGTFGHSSFPDRDARAKFLIALAARAQNAPASPLHWADFSLPRVIPDPLRTQNHPLILTASSLFQEHALTVNYFLSLESHTFAGFGYRYSPHDKPPTPPRDPNEERLAMVTQRNEDEHAILKDGYAPRVL